MARKRKKKFVVSVRDFGAAGDGVTDDTSAFAAAQQSQAVKIKVPPGQYLVTEDVGLETDNRFVSVKKGR